MGKAILFVRVSTEKQGLESQITELKRIAAMDGYSDNDIIVIGNKESAIKLEEEEREGLNELKRQMDQEDVECVYIFELSRLSRKPKVLYSLREQFLQWGVQLKCLNPAFTLLTKDRKNYDSTASIVFSIFGTLTEQEMIEKKQRFHRGKMQLAKEGKFNGGRTPFGYSIDKAHGKKIVINEEEAEIIRLIYNLYESGMSQPRIAQELYERGIKYRNFKGNKRGQEIEFSIWFINQILTNELLTGRLLKGNTASFERVYPPIISETQFDNCREIAKQNSTTHGKPRNLYFGHRLIVCDECGAYFSSSGSKVAYHCYNATVSKNSRDYNGKRGQILCTNQTSISINIMDSLLWHIAQQAECDYIISSAKADKAKYIEKINELEQKLRESEHLLDDIDAKRKRAVMAFINGDITESDKGKLFNQFEKKRQALLQRQAEYINDRIHYQALLSEVDKSSFFSLDEVDEIEQNLEQIISLKKNISAIESDSERDRLIHKHIKSVRITQATISYQFTTKRIGIKKARAKFIDVELYNDVHRYFYFLPNDGKGGHFINSNEAMEVMDNQYIILLNRFRDMTKIRRKEKKQRIKEESIAQKYPSDRKYLFGLKTMSKHIFMSPASILKYMKKGVFKDSITMFDKKTYVMDLEKALTYMRESNIKKLRMYLDKYDQSIAEKTTVQKAPGNLNNE